jgi:hypothetical protein
MTSIRTKVINEYIAEKVEERRRDCITMQEKVNPYLDDFIRKSDEKRAMGYTMYTISSDKYGSWELAYASYISIAVSQFKRIMEEQGHKCDYLRDSQTPGYYDDWRDYDHYIISVVLDFYNSK